MQEFSIDKISMLVGLVPERVVEILVKQLEIEGQSAAEALQTIEDYRNEKGAK